MEIGADLRGLANLRRGSGTLKKRYLRKYADKKRYKEEKS